MYARFSLVHFDIGHPLSYFRGKHDNQVLKNMASNKINY